MAGLCHNVPMEKENRMLFSRIKVHSQVTQEKILSLMNVGNPYACELGNIIPEILLRKNC